MVPMGLLRSMMATNIHTAGHLQTPPPVLLLHHLVTLASPLQATVALSHLATLGIQALVAQLLSP